MSDNFGAPISSRLSMFFFVDLLINGQCQTRVRVLNLSETGIGGVMVEKTPLTLGQEVSICFHGTLFVEGYVAQVKGDQVGIAFVNRLDLAQLRPRGGRKPDPLNGSDPVTPLTDSGTPM